MPISVTSTCVSGSSRRTVNGRPSSLLRLACRRDGRRHGRAERRERVLRRRLADRADDGDDLRVRASPDEARERCERRLLVARHERRRAARERVLDELGARVQRDEQVARPGIARVVVDAADDAVRRGAAQLAERERLDLVPAERDHPRCRSARQRLC